MRESRALAALAGALLVVSLGGCTLVGSSTPASPAPQSSTSTALGGLHPVMPKKLTAAKAKSETLRVANSIQALIAKTDIIYVDNHDKLVAKTSTTGAYYGVLRTVNVSKSLDPLEQASAMEKLLIAAGWTEQQVNGATSNYSATLTSDGGKSDSWLLVLAADTTASKPVVVIQLISPDL
jgi:hypothetical protein